MYMIFFYIYLQIHRDSSNFAVILKFLAEIHDTIAWILFPIPLSDVLNVSKRLWVFFILIFRLKDFLYSFERKMPVKFKIYTKKTERE